MMTRHDDCKRLFSAILYSVHCSAKLYCAFFAATMEECCSLQPSYLHLLLDEEDPEEIWDSCFTSTQLIQAVNNVDLPRDLDSSTDLEQLRTAEEHQIDALWDDNFSNAELLHAVQIMEREHFKPEMPACFDLNCAIIISSDEDEDPVEKKHTKMSCKKMDFPRNKDYDAVPPVFPTRFA